MARYFLGWNRIKIHSIKFRQSDRTYLSHHLSEKNGELKTKSIYKISEFPAILLASNLTHSAHLQRRYLRSCGEPTILAEIWVKWRIRSLIVALSLATQTGERVRVMTRRASPFTRKKNVQSLALSSRTAWPAARSQWSKVLIMDRKSVRWRIKALFGSFYGCKTAGIVQTLERFISRTHVNEP